jgi:hypothetical protein
LEANVGIDNAIKQSAKIMTLFIHITVFLL